MADHVYMVLAMPPEGVGEEEFNDWFDTHVSQILELPGWVAAERFKLEHVKSSASRPADYGYYTRYEIDGSFDEAWAALRAAVDGGRMHFEDWMGDMFSAGYRVVGIRDRVVA